MIALPRPNFLERDPAVIERDTIADFEARTGQPLTPGQPEWLVLQTCAYRETLMRIAIQDAAEQNLAAYARYPMIDHLSAFVAVFRLDPKKSLTTMVFSIEEPLGVDTIIPAGTRWRSKNGAAIFAIDAIATIPAGETECSPVKATATVAGKHANGYLPGQISEPVDGGLAGVTGANSTPTAGGAPQETSERLLERLLLAPDARSTAGSEAGYRYHVLTASQHIEDVKVLSPEPKRIRIVLLDDDGTVTPDIIDLVTAALNAENVRPQNDVVTVEASGVVDFVIEAELVIYKNADAESVLTAALEAAEAYRLSRRKLGRASLREQTRAKLTVPGVYSVNLIEPATDALPAEDEWGRITSVQVSIVGVSEEEDG